MSAYDKYHELVKRALIKDGWTLYESDDRRNWNINDRL